VTLAAEVTSCCDELEPVPAGTSVISFKAGGKALELVVFHDPDIHDEAMNTYRYTPLALLMEKIGEKARMNI
jgi:hypothetical protein